MMWFEQLTGFRESNPDQVRSNLDVNGNKLISKVNGAEFTFGRLEVPSLEELRLQAPDAQNYDSSIKVSEIVGDVQAFHKEVKNEGALFQAASQFNLLEMVGPQVSPDRGVGIYGLDKTQGPACAIACGAGTIYRNYFAEFDGEVGQSSFHQIDCLRDLGLELKNEELGLWKMLNGYAMLTKEGLKNISQQINNRSETEYDALKCKLRIGLQWDTEVTISENKKLVSQAYCSALPVAYSQIVTGLWTEFACLILEATYEATFLAALINYENTGNNQVFLTLVGGGAFGNRSDWILSAIKKSILKFRNTPLQVQIVSYGSSRPMVRALIESLK